MQARTAVYSGNNQGVPPSNSGSNLSNGIGTTTSQPHQNEVQAARRNLLKAMWEASVAPRFSSKPIDMQDYFKRESFVSDEGSSFLDSADRTASNGFASTAINGGSNNIRSSLVASKNLTPSETSFLENLLQSEDLDSIRKASVRLADKELFPPSTENHTSVSVKTLDDETKAETGGRTPDEQSRAAKTLKRRDSEVQQELFRLHESTMIKPSTALLRMTSIQKKHGGFSSTPLPVIAHNNSITSGPEEIHGVVRNNTLQDTESWEINSDVDKGVTNSINDPIQQRISSGFSGSSARSRSWNPFGDVNSWIDGNQGVEVNDEGVPKIPPPTSNPFQILGTSADDVSAHPHVLTPPLMEGLQEFMPESLHEYHFWLKYSLVRDGPRSSKLSHSNDADLSKSSADLPPSTLFDMLTHCRASKYTVLAIETTEGHVFGAFCSEPWRLQGGTYWGSKDSFVWRMRRSRNEPCESIVEQVLMESKIEIFPFTGGNTHIQRCSKTEGLLLGEGEVADILKKEGEHYGNAIRLNSAMTSAWTSTTETFGNPSLAHTDLRGEQVAIANVEMWALTPHTSIESAITLEMNQLFLAENRSAADKNLDLFEILVGGPV